MNFKQNTQSMDQEKMRSFNRFIIEYLNKTKFLSLLVCKITFHHYSWASAFATVKSALTKKTRVKIFLKFDFRATHLISGATKDEAFRHFIAKLRVNIINV